MKRWLLGAGLTALAVINSWAGENVTEEVVVTATKTKQQVKDIAGNVTVITSNEIKESGAGTVDQLLSAQSGIDVAGGGFPGSRPRMDVRGLPGNYGAQRVLVLMDGRPVNEEYLGDVDLRLLPTDNIERIEIVRGPASALYGSNAVGGVINIITKSRTDKEIASLNTTVGSFNTYRTALSHGMQLKDMDYLVTAGELNTDGYLANSDGTPKNWQAQDTSLKTNWKLADNSSLMFSAGNSDGKAREENFIRGIAVNYLNLVYRNSWSIAGKADFTARLYRNGLDQELEWKAFPFTGRYDQFSTGIQLQQSLRPVNKHLVTFGIDAKKEDVLVREANGVIDEAINSQAIYVQDEMTFGGAGSRAIIGTVGLRYDRHEEFGGEVSPRIGAVYHLNDRTALHLAVGKAYRAPSVSDMFLPTTPYGPVTFEGNPNLKPETLWSIEAGADYKFNKDLSGRMTLSQSTLKDAWDHMRDPDTIYRPHNVTRMAVNAIEAEMKYQVIEPLGLFANYTLNNAVYKEAESNPAIEGNRVEEIPLNRGNLGLRFQANNTTVLNLKTAVTGPRYTDPENNRANKLGQYAATEISVMSEINKNSSFFISVHNLFDRQYKEVIEYYQPGRWFEAGFAVKF